jgi:hypothetical protein
MQSKHPTVALARDAGGFSAYFSALCRRLTSSVLHRLGQEPRWGITLFEGDWTQMDAALRASRPVPNPPGRFFADPFVIERDGRTYCFVEDYVHARGKAHITVLEYRAGVVKEIGPCLEEPFHLSFPFLFDYQRELYLCPEASTSSSVRIYRCVEFPLRWELVRVTLPGFPALDTVLFERQGRWWLLTCRSSGANDPFGSELHIFHADSPLSEHWTPLPGNPVIADPRCGRNGGLIRDGERLLRIAQYHEPRHYGRRATVREITRLDESGYAERVVASLEPNFRPGLISAHHLTTTGRVTAVDHQSWAPAFPQMANGPAG